MSRRAGSTFAEIAGSHALYVSQAKAVAGFIDRAAKQIAAKTMLGSVRQQPGFMPIEQVPP